MVVVVYVLQSRRCTCSVLRKCVLLALVIYASRVRHVHAEPVRIGLPRSRPPHPSADIAQLEVGISTLSVAQPDEKNRRFAK